jgi:hypothetical protein
VLLEDTNAVIYGDGGKLVWSPARGPGSSSPIELWRTSRRWPRRVRRLEQVKMVGIRRGEPMNSKLVSTAFCTEDILIANES